MRNAVPSSKQKYKTFGWHLRILEGNLSTLPKALIIASTPDKNSKAFLWVLITLLLGKIKQTLHYGRMATPTMLS
jgi:hypothetical protein